MKIYSASNAATVTFVSKIGIVATVLHFYRGLPVYLETKRGAVELSKSKKYDIWLGFSDSLVGSPPVKISPNASQFLKPGMEVEIHTDNGIKRAMITRVIQVPETRFPRYVLDYSVGEKGDSGAPVKIDGVIVGYLTHSNAFLPSDPLYSLYIDVAKNFSKELAQQHQTS